MNNYLIVGLSFVVLALLIGVTIAQPYKIIISEDKVPLLDINILCTKSHNSVLFKGYDLCVHVPKLNQALSCHG